VAYGHLPYAPGGNIGMWREVFESVGEFDEHMRRAEDIDFGWRAHQLGISVHFEPSVVLHRRLRTSALEQFRSAVAGGRAETELFRRHRVHGMEAAPFDEVWEQYRWLVRKVPDVITGRADRHQWAHHAGKRVGRLVGSARQRPRFL
jgi:GT2 family glycosyltransferase